MLTDFHLKLLAFGLMIIDHVGRLFFPQAFFMVALGRVSFPLFAYLVANGEKYSKNIKTYLFRLVVLGVLTQPIYGHYVQLVSKQNPQLNILFGLALGVVTIRLVKTLNNPSQKLTVVTFFSGIALLSNIEGGLNTILTIILMAMFQNNLRWWLSYVLLTVFSIAFLAHPPIALFRLGAPVILSFHNGKQGPKSRLFYLIYPLHFLAILDVNNALKGGHGV